MPLVGHVLLELPLTVPARGSSSIDAYEAAIPPRPAEERVPLRAPVVLRATWLFSAPDDAWSVDADVDLALEASWLHMVLVHRGYLVRGTDVALAVLAKRTSPVPGVRVYLRTLRGADDTGVEFAMDARPRRRIHPLPDQGLSDARAVELGRLAGERPYPSFPTHASRRTRR